MITSELLMGNSILNAGGFQSVVSLELHGRSLCIRAKIPVNAVLAEVITELFELGLNYLHIVTNYALPEVTFSEGVLFYEGTFNIINPGGDDKMMD